MAELTPSGTVRARCPDCDGALVAFEFANKDAAFGVVVAVRELFGPARQHRKVTDYRLFRCGGCGRGGLGVIDYTVVAGGKGYPGVAPALLAFHPDVTERLPLPADVPIGIATEFREAEACLDANCDRAAAGLFRSVLDKTMRANGYKVKNGTTLEQQIDMAGTDGVITEARRRRAHDEIRVLGNDVLHDEWHEIPRDDVIAARHYAQRILEDFYDDRPSTLALLKAKGRETDEVKAEKAAAIAAAAGPTTPGGP